MCTRETDDRQANIPPWDFGIVNVTLIENTNMIYLVHINHYICTYTLINLTYNVCIDILGSNVLFFSSTLMASTIRIALPACMP